MWSVGFMSWNKSSQKCSICTKSLSHKNVVHKLVKLIRPPDRCGISRSWLNSMIITTGAPSFFTQHNDTDVSCFWGSVLTAGMSTRTVVSSLNVHFSTISYLQRCFGEFGSRSNRLDGLHNCNHAAQDHRIWHLHLWDCLRPATRKADGTEEYFYL